MPEGRPRITDGGIETHLIFNMGEELPLFSAFVLNESERGRAQVRRYYRDYLPVAKAAGTEFVFAADTWRASPDWAAQVGYSRDALRSSNRVGIELCREMQDEFAGSGVDGIVAGVIGPRRDAWVHDAAMSIGEAESYHALQIETFASAGADEVHVLTLTNTPEAIGIAKLAGAAGLPAILSFTVETDGRLPGGKPLGTAIQEVDDAIGGSVAYFMINCAHPSHFRTLLERADPWVGRIGGLRANASVKSHAELDASPAIDIGDIGGLADEHRTLLPALSNLQLIGGCCGTDHRHIAAICDACLSATPAPPATPR